MALKNLTVKQNSDAEVSTEIIAESIVEISRGMKKLRGGRLNDTALVTLLKASTGQSARTIQDVLDGLNSLEAKYIRKPVK